MTTEDKTTTPAGMPEAPAKFEHESSGLELFREEQKAWSELSFIREEDGKIPTIGRRRRSGACQKMMLM